MLRVTDSIQLNDLTIQGFSRSGYLTCIAVPELDVLFDIGAVDLARSRISQVLLSHVHTDHSHGLLLYRHLRELQSSGASRVYMPEAQVGAFESVIDAWDNLVLKMASKRCHLMPVRAGQTIALKKAVQCKILRVDHSIDSVGFVLSQTRKKLKPEFQGLAGPEIGALVRSGTEVNDYREHVRVAYIGDSTIKSFHFNPELMNVPILISECTYIDDRDYQNAAKYGHSHLNDLIPFIRSFRGDCIILKHFSLKYRYREIVETLQRKIPRKLHDRVCLLLGDEDKRL